MSLRRAAVIVTVLLPVACDAPPPVDDSPAAKASDLPQAAPNVLYAIGAALAEQVKSYQLDEAEAREIARGLTDATLGKVGDEVRSSEMGARVKEFHEARLQELARREELAGAYLIEQAAREPGALKTESGAILHVIEPGSGAKPNPYDLVFLNHEGKLRDGSVFRTNQGSPPEKGKLGTHTRCWQEALTAVAAGGRVRVVCPPAISYGWGGWPGVVPGGSVLRYELELVSVEPLERPADWQPDWSIDPPTPIAASQ